MSRTQAFHRRAARYALPLLVAVTAVGTAASASAQSLAVKLWSDRGDGAVYQPGDPINIAVRTNRDANLIVYEIDAEGAVHVLFPWQGNDTGIDGGETLELPQDPGDQLVVEGPVGEGYIVAIASEEPFRRLPWYLRPRDARAEELGYTADDRSEDGVTPDGKIVGDPFVAMERIRRQVVADPSDPHAFATAYTSYYVHHAVRYPRYLCNDCHRPGYWAWWDGFDPYYAHCSAFDFRINASWWWGPTYWTTYVPYYAYVCRTSCPPRYRSRGPWYSSWDGWRRWNGNWGGPLRRYKSAPPAGYVGPSRWERSRNERGANTPLPPGFLASAHERPPGVGLPSSGIRRERREGWTPATGSSNNGPRPGLRDNGSRGAGRQAPGERWGSRGAGAWRPSPGERRWGSGATPPPDLGRGGSGWRERGGGYQPRQERGSGAQQPNPGGREERSQHERGRWSAPRAEPAPAAPAPREGRGERRSERARQPENQKTPDSTPPQQGPDKSERPQRNDDGWKSRPDREKHG